MTPLESTEATLNTFVREYLVDNPIDSVAQQINQILVQIYEAGPESQTVAARMLPQLEELYARMNEILLSHKDVVSGTIDTLDEAIRTRVFERQRNRDKLTTQVVRTDARILEPKQQVAAKIARSHDLWILASVVQHIPESNSYEVEDEDSGDEDQDNGHRHHVISTTQVVSLPHSDASWIKYPINARVMAMYPNTTSFYFATVVIPNPEGSTYVVVRFDDDADDAGRIPVRKIPYRYIALVPDHLLNG